MRRLSKHHAASLIFAIGIGACSAPDAPPMRVDRAVQLGSGEGVRVLLPPRDIAWAYHEWQCQTAGFADPPIERARRAEALMAERIGAASARPLYQWLSATEGRSAEALGCQFAGSPLLEHRFFQYGPTNSDAVKCYMTNNDKNAVAARAGQAVAYMNAEAAERRRVFSLWGTGAYDRANEAMLARRDAALDPLFCEARLLPSSIRLDQ